MNREVIPTKVTQKKMGIRSDNPKPAVKITKNTT
jgi:hypothetical protein